MYFETALGYLRSEPTQTFARREAWKPTTCIYINKPVDGVLSFLAVTTSHGRAPWTPTRCDMFTNDWRVKLKNGVWIYD